MTWGAHHIGLAAHGHRLDASPGINLIRSFAGAGPPEDLRLKKP